MILIDSQLPKEIAQSATISEAIEIIHKLEYELRHSSIAGCGLSAPQIGINKSVAIVRIANPLDQTNPYDINLVNPRLVQVDGVVQFDEGCLSFPGASCKTVRYGSITVETMDDYAFQASSINGKRYDREEETIAMLADDRRMIDIFEANDNPEIRRIERLVSVCVQHEMSHLIAKTMFDFAPHEVGRNDKCPIHPDRKNKKCCSVDVFNANLKLLLNPTYRGAQ